MPRTALPCSHCAFFSASKPSALASMIAFHLLRSIANEVDCAALQRSSASSVSMTSPAEGGADQPFCGAEISTSTPASRMSTHTCLLYTSDAADERSSVDLGGRRI